RPTRYDSRMSEQDEFIAAIRAGDADRVTALLDADASLADARAGDTSALLLAIYHGHPEIARLIAGRRSSFSFHEASALGDLDRVRAMLAADPSLLHTYSDDGYAPLG